MDTLAAYSVSTLHRAGERDWSPPLSIHRAAPSPQPNNGHCYHCWAAQTRVGTHHKSPCHSDAGTQRAHLYEHCRREGFLPPPPASFLDSKVPPSSFVPELTCAGRDVLKTVG